MALSDILKKNGITPSSQSGEGGESGGANAGGAEGGGANAGGNPGAGAANPGGESGGNEPEISDDVLVKEFNKRNKTEFKSWAELQEKISGKPKDEELTVEQKEAAAKKRKDEIRIFGLNKGLVSSTDLDAYVQDSSKDPDNLAYLQWKKDRLEGVSEEDRPTDEDLADEFKEEHFLFADEDDPKRKRMEKKIKQLADAYLKETYANVFSLENEYQSHTTEQEMHSNYQSTMQEVFTSIGDSLAFNIKDSAGKEHAYGFKLTPEMIEEAKALFTSPDSFNRFGKDKTLTKDHLTNAVRSGLTTKHLEKIIGYVAETHANNLLLAEGRGRRGIPVVEGGTGNGAAAGATLGNANPNMKRHLDKHKKQTQGS